MISDYSLKSVNVYVFLPYLEIAYILNPKLSIKKGVFV